jgi:antitoxin VapB
MPRSRSKSTERTAALFMNGGSQAVRLPKEFRLPGEQVRIRREGRTVVLEPVAKAEWPEGFWSRLEKLGPVTGDFKAPEPLPTSPQRDRALDSLDEG